MSVFFGQTVIPVMVETVTELELTEERQLLTRLMDFGGRPARPRQQLRLRGCPGDDRLDAALVGALCAVSLADGNVAVARPALGGSGNCGARRPRGNVADHARSPLPLDQALSLTVGVVRTMADPNAAAASVAAFPGVAAGQQCRSCFQQVDADADHDGAVGCIGASTTMRWIRQ